jgi:carbonic anhydrase/acetyltransferase-like protein (isoleucine patch superfamily)
MTGFREDFDVDRLALAGHRLVDGRDDFLDVLCLGLGSALSDLAVEIPEIDAFRTTFFPLPLQIFPDIALDLLDDPRGLVARGSQGKLLFHDTSLWSAKLILSRISRRFFKACGMAIETFAGIFPTIHESVFIAASADVIGRVTLHEETSVWYNATLRGDINEIIIGPRSNVQDNAVIHLADDYGCYVGELVTVGHSAILHACTVKDEVLIGMGAIVLDGAVIGERSIIGAGALVTGGTIIPPGSLVLGSPAKVVRSLPLDEQLKIRSWADKYVMGSRKYLERK